MRLFQRVGAVLPGRRRSLPDDREAQAAGSAWAAFAQSDTTSPAAQADAEASAEPLPTEPEAKPTAEPESAPAAAPAPAGPELPDLMALLPPELRQPAGSLPPQLRTEAASDGTAGTEAPELDPTAEALLGLLSDAPSSQIASAHSPLTDPSALLAEVEALPESAENEPTGAELPEAEPEAGPPAAAPEEDPLTDSSFGDEFEELPPPAAAPSSLSALLADGFGQLDRPGAAPIQPAPAQPAPSASSLSDMLADSFRQLDRSMSARPSLERPEPFDLDPDEDPEEEEPPGRSARSPEPTSAGTGLAAFLADGFRHLDVPASDPRPEPPHPAQPSRSPLPPADAVAPGLPANPSLAGAAEIAGLIGVALVDSESGLLLASEGRGLDLDALAALSTQVVRAEQDAIRDLQLDDGIEDILVTMGRQLHVIRPLQHMPTVFLYLALDRKAANLGMARMQLGRIERRLVG